MKKYVSMSLETNLFFGRIMKEHAFFLLAAFPAKETVYREKADWFRREFEKLLKRVVWISNGIVGKGVLCSGEVVTEFTEMAELQTRRLTGIPINIQITRAEKKLQADFGRDLTRKTVEEVKKLNQKALWLLNGLIALKEKILREVTGCKLYTTNYPLLIEHILREAKLYRQILISFEQKGCMPLQDLREAEVFWNQIMMEHAQFIRGLLDPTECELIQTADAFAEDYCRLIKEARKQDCRAMDGLTGKILETTEQYRDFKVAGTERIIGCKIQSMILPLLADHVLREANHYLRILKQSEKGV